MHQEFNSDMIRLNVDADYHQLREVVLCSANEFGAGGLDLTTAADDVGVDDAALGRQFAANRFEASDVDVVVKQQRSFARTLQARGVAVHWARQVPGALAQHYTRDIGVVIGDTFFVARSQRSIRQQELAGIRELRRRMTKVAWLEAGTLEGGDVLVDERFVMVGLGEETNHLGVESLRVAMEEAGVHKDVHVLELSLGGVIHTDTKLALAGPGIVIADRTAFKPVSWRWIESNFDVIVAEPDEVWDVQVNVVSIAPDVLAMSSTATRLAKEVERRGVEPVMLDYTEVTKLPGSLRCTTLPLLRESSSAKVS